VSELRIDAGDALLAATYTPAGPLAVVALHGASEGHRQFALYEHLHATLPADGVGVVTFDRRGEGESSGTPSVGHLELQARDAAAVIDEIGLERVVIWGFSQGAWVAPLVASPAIVGLVVVGAAGVTPADQMRYGVAVHLAAAGFDRTVVDEAITLRDQFRRAMRHEEPDESSLAARLRASASQPWWPLCYLPAALPDDAGRAEWVREMEHDPLPAMSATKVPVLALWGREDAWTPVAASLAAWRAARGDAVTTRVYPGVGHDLRDAVGVLEPDYPPTLRTWIASTGTAS